MESWRTLKGQVRMAWAEDNLQFIKRSQQLVDLLSGNRTHWQGDANRRINVATGRQPASIYQKSLDRACPQTSYTFADEKINDLVEPSHLTDYPTPKALLRLLLQVDGPLPIQRVSSVRPL